MLAIDQLAREAVRWFQGRRRGSPSRGILPPSLGSVLLCFKCGQWLPVPLILIAGQPGEIISAEGRRKRNVPCRHPPSCWRGPAREPRHWQRSIVSNLSRKCHQASGTMRHFRPTPSPKPSWPEHLRAQSIIGCAQTLSAPLPERKNPRAPVPGLHPLFYAISGDALFSRWWAVRPNHIFPSSK
jgi:hypothetical protein